MTACDETRRVDVLDDALCYGWIEKGYPWHGCDLEPGHDGGENHSRIHECRCGHTWRTRARPR